MWSILALLTFAPIQLAMSHSGHGAGGTDMGDGAVYVHLPLMHHLHYLTSRIKEPIRGADAHVLPLQVRRLDLVPRLGADQCGGDDRREYWVVLACGDREVDFVVQELDGGALEGEVSEYMGARCLRVRVVW